MQLLLFLFVLVFARVVRAQTATPAAGTASDPVYVVLSQGPDASLLSPEAAGLAFAWGFAAILGFFFIGYVLAVALGLVRKVG